MSEYYAVQRSTDHLAHYGIRGMKWGVRKAIEKGNTKRLGRQYAKAQKKLAKLEAKADVGVQRDKAKKYGKVAKIAAGVGVSGIGTATGSRILSGKLIGLSKQHGESAKHLTEQRDYYIDKINKQRDKTKAANWELLKDPKNYSGISKEEAIRRTERWNREIVDKFADKDIAREKAYYDPSIKSHQDKSVADARGSKIANTAHKIAGGIGVAGLATAAVAGGKSAVAKYRTSQKGHAKAVAKRDAWKKEMQGAFKGTTYQNLLKANTKKSRRK